MSYKAIVLTVAVITCIVNGSLSQPFEGEGLTVNPGQVITNKGNKLNGFILGDDDKLFSVNQGALGSFIVGYDSKGGEENRTNLREGIVPLDGFIIKIECFKQNVLVFYISINDKTREEKVHYVAHSQRDLSISTQATELLTIPYNRKKRYPDVNIQVRNNINRIVVYSIIPGPSIYEPKEHVVWILNENLSVLWTKKLDVPEGFLIRAYQVNKFNRFYVLGKTRKPKDKRKRKEDGYIHEFFMFSQTDSVVKHVIDLPTKTISSISFITRKNGNIICTGLYSQNSYSEAEGIFFLEFGKDGLNVIKSSKEDYGFTFYTEGKSDTEKYWIRQRVEDGKSLSFKDIELRQLIESRDGSLIMVSEKFYTSTVEGDYHQTIVHRDDLIVSKIDSNGKVVWHNRVQKKQSGRYDDYTMGHNISFNNADVHLFFVALGGDVEAFDLNEKEDKEMFKKQHFVHVLIDSNGKRTVRSLGVINNPGGAFNNVSYVPDVRRFKSTSSGFIWTKFYNPSSYKIGWIQIN